MFRKPRGYSIDPCCFPRTNISCDAEEHGILVQNGFQSLADFLQDVDAVSFGSIRPPQIRHRLDIAGLLLLYNLREKRSGQFRIQPLLLSFRHSAMIRKVRILQMAIPQRRCQHCIVICTPPPLRPPPERR